MRSIVIKKEKAEEFIKESNKNKISEEFLRECREAAVLFNTEDREDRAHKDNKKD